MGLINQILLLDRIHFHIEHKSTGSPKEFAVKLNISERQLYRLLEELRDSGIEIIYESRCNSYVYKVKVKIQIQMTIGENELNDRKGKLGFDFNILLPEMAARLSNFTSDNNWESPNP